MGALGWRPLPLHLGRGYLRRERARRRRDPIGDAGQSLEAEDFAWATRAILEVARARAKGRVVSSLEGGYDLEALGQSALAHVKALAEG